MPYAISQHYNQSFKIYYEVIGDTNKPPLIFAHGNGKSDKPHDSQFYTLKERTNVKLLHH